MHAFVIRECKVSLLERLPAYILQNNGTLTVISSRGRSHRISQSFELKELAVSFHQHLSLLFENTMSFDQVYNAFINMNNAGLIKKINNKQFLQLLGNALRPLKIGYRIAFVCDEIISLETEPKKTKKQTKQSPLLSIFEIFQNFIFRENSLLMDLKKLKEFCLLIQNSKDANFYFLKTLTGKCCPDLILNLLGLSHLELKRAFQANDQDLIFPALCTKERILALQNMSKLINLANDFCYSPLAQKFTVIDEFLKNQQHTFKSFAQICKFLRGVPSRIMQQLQQLQLVSNCLVNKQLNFVIKKYYDFVAEADEKTGILLNDQIMMRLASARETGCTENLAHQTFELVLAVNSKKPLCLVLLSDRILLIKNKLFDFQFHGITNIAVIYQKLISEEVKVLRTWFLEKCIVVKMDQSIEICDEEDTNYFFPQQSPKEFLAKIDFLLDSKISQNVFKLFNTRVCQVKSTQKINKKLFDGVIHGESLKDLKQKLKNFKFQNFIEQKRHNFFIQQLWKFQMETKMEKLKKLFYFT